MHMSLPLLISVCPTLQVRSKGEALRIDVGVRHRRRQGDQWQ